LRLIAEFYRTFDFDDGVYEGAEKSIAAQKIPQRLKRLRKKAY
jgi:hypothetical protein